MWSSHDPELRQVVSDRRPRSKAVSCSSPGCSAARSTTSRWPWSAGSGRTHPRVRAALAGFAQVAIVREGRLQALVPSRTSSPDEKQRLAGALARKYGREVHLNVTVDPSVIGGLAVSVGDEVVDATMSTRLEVARRGLAG